MSFDVNRLRRADWIVGVGAVALFIFMFFFKWFGGSVSGTTPIGGISTGSSTTGWDTFTNSRWLWLLTIIVALGAVVLVAGQRELDLPAKPGAIVATLGGLSSLFILYRIIHHPHGSASFGGVHASYGIKIGIWLGLIAALAITYGGYLQMQEEDASPYEAPEQAAGVSAPTSPPPPPAAFPPAATSPAPTPSPPAEAPSTTPPIPSPGSGTGDPAA